MALFVTQAVARQGASAGNNRIGLVDDWTHHHLIFSNPGSMFQALQSGSLDRWQKITGDPRFGLEQLKRSSQGASARTPEQDSVAAAGAIDRQARQAKLKRDWSVTLGSGGTPDVAAGMYPAKYTFSTSTAPLCTDFLVVGINKAGVSGGQANIIGLNNLYSGTGTTFCNASGPSFLFSYFVGTGTVKTSPVLSLDGKKIAFVESISGASKFHVVTIGTTGSNGTSATTSATPGTGNNAVDTSILLSASVTSSSPFIDYNSDTAYVGDDNGVLHKIHPVFNTTPLADTPVTVASGVTLTGPVFDQVTNNTFVGGSDGNLYSITPTNSVTHTVISGGCAAVLDPPIVDSSDGTVFTQAGKTFGTNCNGGASDGFLFQLSTTSLNSIGSVDLGAGSGNGAVINARSGAFDQAYFNAGGKGGHIYYCFDGKLERAGFNGSGTIVSDSSSLTLRSTGTGENCSPATEFFNTVTNKDWLFLGVPTSGGQCTNSNGCVLNFDITSGTFPSSASVVFAFGSTSGGTSGFVVDNVGADPAWQPTHSYTANSLITDNNGNVEKSGSGTHTSGSTQPLWSTTVGNTTSDGGVTWTNQGPDQTASTYFGTLTGKTAVKLTQAGLQ